MEMLPVFKSMHRAGVPLLAGTDGGVTSVGHGGVAHAVLALHREVGLDLVDALWAGTRDPAAAFGLAETTGSLSLGSRPIWSSSTATSRRAGPAAGAGGRVEPGPPRGHRRLAFDLRTPKLEAEMQRFEYRFTKLDPIGGDHIDPPSVAVYETLLKKGADEQPEPGLASAWSDLAGRSPLASRASRRGEFHSGDACDAPGGRRRPRALPVGGRALQRQLWYWDPVDRVSAVVRAPWR